MNGTGELWAQIHRALEFHRKAKDRDGQSTLDRLSKEWVGSSSVQTFNPNTCTVREETIPFDDLKHLELRHQRARPERLDGPIVLLQIGDRRMVIDGSTRANAWKAGKFGGPFSAIVIEPNKHAV